MGFTDALAAGHHYRAVLAIDGLDVLKLDCSVILGLNLGLFGDAGRRTADVERTQRKLGPRLPD